MQFNNVRWFAALAFACVLSACAGSSSSNNASAAQATTEATATASKSSGPCRLPGLWNFEGACTAGSLTPSGATFTLPNYRNLSATLAYGKNDAARPLAFVVGDATGDGDITGLLNAKVAFPMYGTAGCIGPRGTPAQCSGKAVLYLLVINLSGVPVRFEATPQIQVSRLDGFPGKYCELQTMVWSDALQSSAVWISHGRVAPVGGEIVTFRHVPSTQRYRSQGALTVYAVTCG